MVGRCISFWDGLFSGAQCYVSFREGRSLKLPTSTFRHNTGPLDLRVQVMTLRPDPSFLEYMNLVAVWRPQVWGTSEPWWEFSVILVGNQQKLKVWKMLKYHQIQKNPKKIISFLGRPPTTCCSQHMPTHVLKNFVGFPNLGWIFENKDMCFIEAMSTPGRSKFISYEVLEFGSKLSRPLMLSRDVWNTMLRCRANLGGFVKRGEATWNSGAQKPLQGQIQS